jgi:hypothetical protein
MLIDSDHVRRYAHSRMSLLLQEYCLSPDAEGESALWGVGDMAVADTR